MYCPKCFNDTLKLSSSGVAKLLFNGKSKSTSQFYFDLKKESYEESLKKFAAKVDEYFIWYKSLNNVDPISNFKLMSGDFLCSNRCSIGGAVQLSVIDLVIQKKDALRILREKSSEHGVQLDFKRS